MLRWEIRNAFFFFSKTDPSSFTTEASRRGWKRLILRVKKGKPLRKRKFGKHSSCSTKTKRKLSCKRKSALWWGTWEHIPQRDNWSWTFYQVPFSRDRIIIYLFILSILYEPFYDKSSAMQNDEPTGFVSYSRFELKMLEILRGKTLEPDSSDVMLQVSVAIVIDYFSITSVHISTIFGHHTAHSNSFSISYSFLFLFLSLHRWTCDSNFGRRLRFWTQRAKDI